MAVLAIMLFADSSSYAHDIIPACTLLFRILPCYLGSRLLDFLPEVHDSRASYTYLNCVVAGVGRSRCSTSPLDSRFGLSLMGLPHATAIVRSVAGSVSVRWFSVGNSLVGQKWCIFMLDVIDRLNKSLGRNSMCSSLSCELETFAKKAPYLHIGVKHIQIICLYNWSWYGRNLMSNPCLNASPYQNFHPAVAEQVL